MNMTPQLESNTALSFFFFFALSPLILEDAKRRLLPILFFSFALICPKEAAENVEQVNEKGIENGH